MIIAPHLTPSEMTLLHAARFNGSPDGYLYSNSELFQTQTAVPSKQLAQTTIATAIVASEGYSEIHLRVRPKKSFLGIPASDLLYCDVTRTDTRWPPDSLEAMIKRLATVLAEKGRNDVESIVSYLLPGRVESPGDYIIKLVIDLMVERGWLERTQETSKWLKILPITKEWYRVPEQTVAYAAKQPFGSLQELLAAYQCDRVEVWNLLVLNINRALERRTGVEWQEGG